MIEVELHETLQDYLRSEINSDLETIKKRAAEAKAVATLEQRIYQRKLDEANRDNIKTTEVYELMRSTGATAHEIIILTGHPVSSVIPKLKSLMAKKQDYGTIIKSKEVGTIIYRIIDAPPSLFQLISESES